MIFSVWYSIEEKSPEESGWYFCFKGISFGDDSEEIGMYYYDNNRQQFFTHTAGAWVNVTYWTEVDYSKFVPKSLNPSEKIAADNVIKSIENYNLISGLSS